MKNECCMCGGLLKKRQSTCKKDCAKRHSILVRLIRAKFYNKINRLERKVARLEK